jgi:hypothetical protein
MALLGLLGVRLNDFAYNNFICNSIFRIYRIQLWGTASTSNIEILERFQSNAWRMIADAPWYVPNTVIRRDFQIPTVKEEIRSYNIVLASAHSKLPNSKPHGATRQQAIAKTSAKLSAYQISSVIVLFVNSSF